MREGFTPKIESDDSGDKEMKFFETDKRPEYRYYYHGTFQRPVDEIKASRVFQFTEHKPNLTLSPDYGFSFAKREAKNPKEQGRKRGRYLSREERETFIPDERDSVLLVIEPAGKYNVHATTEGTPNVFSTDDQIPEDINETVRTRIWTSNQYKMYHGPKVKKTDDGIRHPGIWRNRRMLKSGEWVELERSQQQRTPGELPADCVRMVIKRDQDFLNIFKEMKAELDQGEKIGLTKYKQRLMEYFKTSQAITKYPKENESINEEKLAENMIMGELEHEIVRAIRTLYLDIERCRGKRFISHKTNKEDDEVPKNREDLLDEIEKLKSIKPENEVLKRYIEINTKNLEKEIN